MISDATTETNGGGNRLTANADTLTITVTGSVATAGVSQYGIQANLGGTTITHNGPITTTGISAIGISVGTPVLAITGDVTIRGSGNINFPLVRPDAGKGDKLGGKRRG